MWLQAYAPNAVAAADVDLAPSCIACSWLLVLRCSDALGNCCGQRSGCRLSKINNKRIDAFAAALKLVFCVWPQQTASCLVVRAYVVCFAYENLGRLMEWNRFGLA